MRSKLVGNKKDSELLVVYNGEASAAIAKGTPLVLKIGNAADTSGESSTNKFDGLSVVLPATAGAAASGSLMYGVTPASIANAAYGETIAFGYVPYALFTRATRAASTDSWTSSQSLAQYQILALDTINNAFLVASVSVGSVNYKPHAVLVESVSSIAASASNTSDTRTVLTTAQRVFVRML